MSRTLTPALLTELGNPVTTPAYLIEIQFSTTVRISTRGTIIWNGNTWNPGGAKVGGLGNDIGAVAQSGSLSLIDSGFAISVLILREGIANRGINVWKFYGVAPEDADPVQIFAGVGDSAAMDSAASTVSITLLQRGARELYAPRRFMTRATGFSVLPVNGRIVTFNDQDFKLEADRG